MTVSSGMRPAPCVRGGGPAGWAHAAVARSTSGPVPMSPSVNAVLYDVALTAYLVATAAALAHLVDRRERLWRFSVVTTQVGWVCHTVALVGRGVELGRLPLVSPPEVVSAVIWAVVLLELWTERQYRVKSLGAFVLPIVSMLGLALPTGLRLLVSEPGIRSAWIWVHVALALLGLA